MTDGQRFGIADVVELDADWDPSRCSTNWNLMVCTTFPIFQVVFHKHLLAGVTSYEKDIEDGAIEP